MNSFIVLLRAVNVSGKNIIKMTELKSHLDYANFKNVKTYIQSGNIILKSELDKHKIQRTITDLIHREFDLDVYVFTLTAQELHNIIENNPFPNNPPPNKVYSTLLAHTPAQEDIDKLNQIDLGEERYVLKDDVFYFYVPEGMANSKLSNQFIENKLKVKATGRNLNTILKLKDLLLTID